MTESLRGRLAVDLMYANRHLKIFNLAGDGTVLERVDGLIHGIFFPKSNTVSNPHLIQGSSRLESLKILLLMKFELSQIAGSLETSVISVQTSKLVLKLCLFDFDNSLPSLNSDVLEINLWLLNENDFKEIATSLLRTCQECLRNFLLSGACSYEGSDISPVNVLNLIESALVVISEKNSTKGFSFHQVYILCDPVNFGNVFVDLAFNNDNNSLANQTLLKIFPKFLSLPFKVLLLEKIWSRVKREWLGIKWNEFKSHKLYYVLCSLSNNFFPPKLKKDEENGFLIVKDGTLWEVILLGIGQNDSLIRKQSRFLLRKALDFIQLNSDCMGTSLTLELLNWHSCSANEFFKIWSEYFLVLEALEEKQTHLIEPILKNFEVSTSSKFNASISAAWNLPVYLGMLNHDSNSIVKWGLRLFLTQNLDMYSSPSVSMDSFILYPLIEALNNNYLFMKQEDEFDIDCSLQNLFSSFEKNMPKEIKYNFYSLILSRMCSINWGPVSLFFIMRSLSSIIVDDRPWDNSSLAAMKLFLTNTIHTHSPLIRGAVQSCLLEMMVNFFDNNLSLFHLADIFGVFCCNEALRRGSESWELIVNWLKTFINEEKASNFISCSLSQFINPSASTNPGVCVNAKAFTCMCLLLFDASFFLVGGEGDQIKAFYLLMNPLFKYYVKISSRPFVANQVIDCNIKVLSNFVEGCNCLSVPNDITKRVILVVTSNLIEDVICCYLRRLRSVKHVDDYNTVQLYIQALHTFSKEKKLLPPLLKVSEELLENAFATLESQKDLTLAKYFSMKILSWFASLFVDKCSFSTGYSKLFKAKLSAYMKNYISSGYMSRSYDVVALSESNCDRDFHTLKTLIKSEYLQLHWTVLHSLLKIGLGKEVVLSMRKPDLFMSDAIDSVEMGGREILSPVMSVLQILLPEVIKESFDLALECCSVCWKATFEHKKSDYFWVAIEKFIEMMFQEEIMLMAICEKHILKYAQDLYSHGQTVGRIFQLFISHLTNKISSPILWKSYYTVLGDALVYGPLLRKDQRIYKDTCEYILSFGPKYCLNSSITCEFSYSTNVRVKAVACLINIVKMELEVVKSKSSTLNIAGEVADHLWHNILQTTKEKSRYYGNSHVHRLKQRAMQSLLLLELALNEKQCQNLMDSLCDSLQIESHQPSVKYLQEWLLVRILAHHPKLRQRMWEVFQQAGAKRPGSMSSFISVTFHLSKALPHDEQEEFIGKCIEYIHPWCMAQQFIVRLFAQVVLQKLWEIIVKENFEKTLNKYKVVFDCINSSLEQGGNTQRNLLKLKESFYFEIFHPLDHFSIETIYYDIPRLGNISNDEWIPPSDFESIELHSIIKLKNESEILRQTKEGDWALKASVCRIESVPTDGEVNLNVQKKIMPWKAGDLEETASFLEDMERGKQLDRRIKGSGSLVVVASLIDRMPNLGGLCRTCEAFGVAKYVLGSLKYIEDPQFQNLSVSAERWISITEVKPFMLGVYLTSMKEKGYSLIGAEQTSGSIKLDYFKFPEKSVLLLGNEKEGIPADILPLMDVCVEVPQEGLVRSLNVHVTGAIFMWEYLRQHHPSNSSS